MKRGIWVAGACFAALAGGAGEAAAQADIACRPGKPAYRNAQTTVGEVITGRDTRATFSYGVERSAETSFSLAPKFHKLGFQGGGSTSNMIGSVLARRFGPNTRKTVSVTTQFARYEYRYTDGPRKGRLCYREVVPERVLPRSLGVSGIRSENGVAPGNCRNTRIYDREHRVPMSPGDIYTKTEGSARSFTKGASVFGVGFDTRSGFSKNVQLRFEFGNRYNRYWLCGTGGRPLPGGEPDQSTWNRIFAGG